MPQQPLVDWSQPDVLLPLEGTWIDLVPVIMLGVAGVIVFYFIKKFAR